MLLSISPNWHRIGSEHTSAAWIGRFSNIKRMHNGLQKRYQTRMAATERARGVSISIDAFGIGHSRYASPSVNERVPGVIRPFCDVCPTELDNGRSTDYAAKWI